MKIDWSRVTSTLNCCLLFVLVSFLNCTAARAADQSPIEIQPYRVRIEIGFGSSPQFDAVFRQRILEQVSQGIERYAGDFWQCEVAEHRGGFYSGLAALERLEAGPVLQQTYAANFEKAYLLHLDTAGAGYLSAGREWDAQVRQLGLLATRHVNDRREISESLLVLVRELFRPVAEIERTRAGATTLRVRGGRFHPPDPLWQPARPEQLFEVFYCFLDNDHAVERVQQVPWTYVAAGQVVDEGRSDAVVTSGLRTPLGSRRHRLLTLALGINHRAAGTKLTLMTRAPARKLLAGIEVELSPTPNPAREADRPPGDSPADKQPRADQPAAKNPRLITDRNGIVSVTSASVADASVMEGRPVWLLVHSGPVLLARVPFVPGLHSAETLELPDDSLRLEVEGAIALVQAKLVDTVARRAVLMAMAKNRAKASEWDAMESVWKEIKEMRQAASFASDISVIRLRAVKAAREKRDKSTEQRVQKLCSETLELVNNYLDAEKLAEFRTDLDDMKRTDLDLKAAKAGIDPGPQSEPAKKKAKKKKAATPPPAQPAPAKGF